jgi:pyridoxal phosphate enzyme (YggS family)
VSEPLASPLATRLAGVRERMASAARRAGRRPEAITLVGIAKGQPAARIAEAVAAGLDHVGENYVQEVGAKLPELRSLLAERGLALPRLHFVGRLQRNKALDVARDFDVVESLDRAALGAALEQRAAELGRELGVLLQVNLEGEATKGGAAPTAVRELLAESLAWRHLRIAGLMAIPPPQATPEASRAGFARLRELAQSLRSEPGGGALRELSMGMSADFEIAIEEGATWVRLGSAIFGARPRKGEDPT